MNRTVTTMAALVLLAGCSSSGGEAAPAAPTTSPSVVSATPTPSPSPTGPIVLTKAAAAKRYEGIICTVNKSVSSYNDSFGQAVVGGKPTAATRKAARKTAKVTEKAGKSLVDDGIAWPPKVADDVEKVAEALYELSATLTMISEPGYRWTGGESLNGAGKATSRVRLGLGLPPRGTC